MKRASKDIFKIKRMSVLFKRAENAIHIVKTAKMDNRYVEPKKLNVTN